MVEKSGVEKSGLESSWLKSLGLKGLGLKLGVEKYGLKCPSTDPRPLSQR